MPEKLRSLRFFRSCPDAELSVLAEKFSVRTLAAGEILYAAGDPSTAFYFLISGRIRLRSESWERRTEEPGENLREPDHLFGVAALLGIPRRSSALAIERAHLVGGGAPPQDAAEDVVTLQAPEGIRHLDHRQHPCLLYTSPSPRD